MFNLLIDELPTSVEVSGVMYPINWKATTMIEISILIENKPFGNTEEGLFQLAIKQLNLFYPQIPENHFEAMARLIEFYTFSQDKKKKKNQKEKEKVNTEKRLYSFQYDSSLIYTAFLQQYPTKKIQDLHWFEFKAMLEGLTEDCLFAKVTQYRAIKINSNMSKSEKEFYTKMKKVYALPDDRPAEQKDEDFAYMLYHL